MAKLNAYRFQEPITKVSNVVLGSPCTLELKPATTICTIFLNLVVTASATGAATKTIPRPSWGAGEVRFKLGNVNRKRNASELFGRKGLNAKYAVGNGGTVQYKQAGAYVTAALNGITYGAEPVLIDSPEDVAIQGALANNTATIAEFCLPLIFAEDWRKDPNWAGEAMALPTGFDNGTILGTPFVEVDIPAATGVAGTMTAVALTGSLSYTEVLAKAGTVVKMSKQKLHQKTYAAGDIELGDQFDTKDFLQGFSLLCVADKITKVVVKQGARIIRQVTFAENYNNQLACQFEGRSVLANRFDVDLDINDDPTTALPLNLLQPLSVVATFATAADVPANCRILADYYGPVE